MEELHKAASAYYQNGPGNLQRLATDFFDSIDTNGDDRVTQREFMRFLQQNGYGWVDSNLFNALDLDGDGVLDFEEVLTFYYIVKTRNVWCDGCRVCLMGLYFTCVECFDTGRTSYDLCSDCYADGDYRHRHSCFLDSYMLLSLKGNQARRGQPNSNHTQLVIAPPQQIIIHNPPATPARNRMRQAFQALEAAVAVGNLATMCTIM